MGFCSGIENYSRHLTLACQQAQLHIRCWITFRKTFSLIVDESHVTIPQVRGMFNGDQARKQVLVDHGFRLPSAMDNRPLRFEEFEENVNQTVYCVRNTWSV